MMWTSWIRPLALAMVVILLANNVQADAADGPNGQVAGTILDGKGLPLAEHRVELKVRTFSGGLRATQTVAKTMTDARGRFAFTGLAPGIFEVVVLRGDTMVRTSAPIQLSAGAMDHTLTLSESTGVSFSFEDLRAHVKPGATVKVTDTSGTETTGTVADVSPSSLALLVNGVRRDLPETDVRQIVRRHGNRVGRGALIGTGVGVGMGLGFVASAGGCSNDPECSAIMFGAVLVSGALGTAAGAAIGLTLKKSETIFMAPVLPESARLTVSPIASKARQGLALSISF